MELFGKILRAFLMRILAPIRAPEQIDGSSDDDDGFTSISYLAEIVDEINDDD